MVRKRQKHRRNFATQEEAEKQVAAENKKLTEAQHNLGTQVTEMSIAQIKAAESAYRQLESKQMLPTVGYAAGRFIVMRKRSSAIRTFKSHWSYLKAFCASYGKFLVAAITPADIANFIDRSDVGNVAKLHRWDTLHAFFEFCAGKKNIRGAWIGLNPVKQVPEPLYNPKKPQVYTLPEIRRLIDGAILHNYAPSVVVRLFTMIRADEMADMVRFKGSIWPYVNLDTGWIELTPDEVKTRADKRRGGRRIRISPTLRKWLLVFKKQGQDISENRTFDEKARKHANPEKLGRDSGFNNLIRHSTISYRVAAEGSFAAVADEAGTSETIIRASYYDRVTAKAAAEFFRLTPDKFDLSTPASPRDIVGNKLGLNFHL